MQYSIPEGYPEKLLPVKVKITSNTACPATERPLCGLIPMSFDIVRNGEAQKVNPPYGFKYLYTMDNYDSSDGALPYYYDLGYRFTQKYWGKGYATEASAALMDYAFNKLKIPCVYASLKPTI